MLISWEFSDLGSKTLSVLKIPAYENAHILISYVTVASPKKHYLIDMLCTCFWFLTVFTDVVVSLLPLRKLNVTPL